MENGGKLWQKPTATQGYRPVAAAANSDDIFAQMIK